ncbi:MULTISPECIES: efflux RND transporter periplasmic adaptor subunit [unclassified Rubrivivax]|uniref:efflux RND transporter periplasmic adaptor subunit n=1 Tax=unclassified Rubrivivax TaxID=2649762 RepID=UPI001E47B97A|nr:MULTISPECIES: efflux RND transporter periplasmic adaptor subunit [unclassified Rubrivivax]MCC9597963.1 efflux RND transporter periplasmic adaptor subunit [Rubrivivax sp. JA1055]MCC9645780.1 efflux RND transporter periplasmic adaptor subunit [Rubrivivax sp. JA1029]
MTNRLISTRRLFLIGLTIALAGCEQSMPDMATPPPPVAYLVVAPELMRQVVDLNGRVTAVRTAEIRPQVGGIVLRRLFVQGSEVRAGQPLFQINPAPFKADVDTAAAALRRAEAVLARASTQAERLKPLVETEAISRQTFDDAESQREQAAAEVSQAHADLARRKLDLRFATIEAPISGRVDEASVSEGALVNPSDTNPLARVQQIDQVYVDVRQPAASLDALQRAVSRGRDTGSGVEVQILHGNGRPLNLSGKILFSGISVDEDTGDVLVRILVNNAERRLLPGMFVRARITLAEFPDALSIPQQAVARQGTTTSAWVLDAKHMVHRVPIKTAELIDGRYRVLSGLKDGDQVVVEGLDRMTEGAHVTPRVWLRGASPSTSKSGGSPASGAR